MRENFRRGSGDPEELVDEEQRPERLQPRRVHRVCWLDTRSDVNERGGHDDEGEEASRSVG